MWRHAIGTDLSADACVYHEEDDSFYVGISRSRTEKMLYIHSGGWVGGWCIVGWVGGWVGARVGWACVSVHRNGRKKAVHPQRWEVTGGWVRGGLVSRWVGRNGWVGGWVRACPHGCVRACVCAPMGACVTAGFMLRPRGGGRCSGQHSYARASMRLRATVPAGGGGGGGGVRAPARRPPPRGGPPPGGALPSRATCGTCPPTTPPASGAW